MKNSNFLNNVSVGTKIQIAIAANVVLAVLIGEYFVAKALGLTGTTGIATNLAINGTIAYFFGLAVSSKMTKPLKDSLNDLKVMTKDKWDLTHSLKVSTKDEIGELSTNINAFISKLHGIILQVSNSTGQLASAANKMASATTQTDHAVQQQKSETTQVSSAITEMSATVNEVAQNASEAAFAAKQADDEAKKGTNISRGASGEISNLVAEIEKGVVVIGKLEQECGNIGSILEVITSIAEQTNLLALNAAIEAARAGEQGRGFAVVADEVRTLASRTNQSIQETQEMIRKLQEGAHDAVQFMDVAQKLGQRGNEQVEQAADSLIAIAQSITTITDMNTHIASAAEQQTAVTAEINNNILNINLLSEQSMDASKQVSSTSEELIAMAGELESLLDQFILEK